MRDRFIAGHMGLAFQRATRPGCHGGRCAVAGHGVLRQLIPLGLAQAADIVHITSLLWFFPNPRRRLLNFPENLVDFSRKIAPSFSRGDQLRLNVM